MNRILATLTALAFLGYAGLADAAEASGKVMAVDNATRTIVLEDGTSFKVPDGISIDGLKPGAIVKIAYEADEDGDDNVATNVTQTQ
jgi:hypothetical protein